MAEVKSSTDWWIEAHCAQGKISARRAGSNVTLDMGEGLHNYRLIMRLDEFLHMSELVRTHLAP